MARSGVGCNISRCAARRPGSASKAENGSRTGVGSVSARALARKRMVGGEASSGVSRVAWLRPIDELGRLAACVRSVERNASRVYRRAKVSISLAASSSEARRPLRAQTCRIDLTDPAPPVVVYRCRSVIGAGFFLNPDAIHWLLGRDRIRRRESILQRFVERHVPPSLLEFAAATFGLMLFVLSPGSHPDCHPPIVSRKTMAKRRSC